MEDRKNGVATWVKKHKQQLIRVGKGVGVMVMMAGATYLASLLSGDDKEGGSKMKYGYVTDNWMETASEDELRAVASEMESELDEMDYESDEYLQLDLTHIDVVNAIVSRFPLNLPSREHGWYLPNDD